VEARLREGRGEVSKHRQRVKKGSTHGNFPQEEAEGTNHARGVGGRTNVERISRGSSRSGGQKETKQGFPEDHKILSRPTALSFRQKKRKVRKKPGRKGSDHGITNTV